MSYNRTIQLVAILGMLACLGGAGALVNPIRRHTLGAAATQPAGPDQPVLASGDTAETLPPWVSLAVSSGGPVRAVAIQYLWIRANDLKDEGKYYESNQLAHWTASLQPNFPAVWYYLAWNMAYNISVECHTREERWDWVNKGIAIVRDKGVIYNPKAVPLYKELAWIFLHKLGGNSDDMHWYYKYRFAFEWQEFLGAPADNATTPEAVAQFRKIADAPDTLEELTARDAAAAAVVQRLRQERLPLDESLVRQVGRIVMMSRSLDARILGDSVRRHPDVFDPRLVELLQDPKLAPGLEAMLAHLRKVVLRQTYHMSPAFMLQLMAPTDQGGYGFGPLDWRHPASHACYWGALGVKVAGTVANKEEVDLINTDRNVVQALQVLTDSGRLHFDPVTGPDSALAIDLSPDPRFISAYDLATIDARYRALRELGAGAGDSFKTGHENFLLKCMVYHYLYGNVPEAERFRQRARELYAQEPNNRRTGRYDLPLDDQVMLELTDTIDLKTQARQFVDAMLRRAFVDGLAHNRQAVVNRYVALARRVHARVQKEGEQTTNPNAGTVGRIQLLPFEQVLAETYIDLMSRPEVQVILRARIWANTPPDLQRQTYDRIKKAVHDAARQAQLNPLLAFPEPPGMEGVRESPVGPEAPATQPASPVRVAPQ